MERIKLTQGQFAIVDDADYDWLNQWKWHAANFRGHFYAARGNNGNTLYMARELLGLKRGDKRQADHRNHNTLNNRRDNIRICTHGQNQKNKKSSRNSSSQFKGVCWDGGAWVVAIHTGTRLKYLGRFSKENEKEAAYAYDIAAIKYHGEFVQLNFPDRDYVLPENRIIKGIYTRKNKTSHYKGVSWFKSTKKWRANIYINKKQKSLGYFDVEKEAALAYNRAAIQEGGRFLNF